MNPTYHEPTIDTYNKSASKMADHFQNYGSGEMRVEVIKAFELAGNPTAARAVEIGCGAGKDAAVIAPHCAWYEGFDPSEGLLDIARKQQPKVSFVQSDAVNYTYPEQLDVVFAFASMLHLDRESFRLACDKIATALRPGGVFCLSLKEAPEYHEELQEDDFGSRQFYFYNTGLVQELAGDNFTLVYERHDITGPLRKKWFTVMLKKKK